MLEFNNDGMSWQIQSALHEQSTLPLVWRVLARNGA